ncbi:MAG: hypothetical protein Q8Q52_03430 [Acidimicrobiia bacterium]|nr:hypothetical protein [Acidimicrobiia bacterium]
MKGLRLIGVAGAMVWATAGLHQVAAAEAAGHVEFLDGFDSLLGGMGQNCAIRTSAIGPAL